MAVPSSLVIFLSCINVTLYNFWARIKIVVVIVVVVVVVVQRADNFIHWIHVGRYAANKMCARIYL